MVKRFEKFSLNFSISFFVIPCQSSLSNDRNNPTQHIATLLGATYCVRLATVLPHVARCWVLLAQIWPFSNLSQQHPTCHNTSQHGGQTHATHVAQHVAPNNVATCCAGMLGSFGRGLMRFWKQLCKNIRLCSTAMRSRMFFPVLTETLENAGLLWQSLNKRLWCEWRHRVFAVHTCPQ